MKYTYLLIILLSFINYSCSFKGNKKINDEDSTITTKEIDINDSLSDTIDHIKSNTSKENVPTNIIVTRVGRQFNIDIVPEGNALPDDFIKYLKMSVKECSHCYDLDKDTLKVLKLTENEKESHPLIIKDYNLDGRLDVAIPTWYSCCSGHNVAYKFWLTTGENHELIVDTVISDIPNIELQQRESRITGGYHSNVDENVIYQFKINNGVIELISKTESEEMRKSRLRQTQY